MHPLGTNHKDANQKEDPNQNAWIEHASWEILIIKLAHLGRYFTLNDRLYAHMLEVRVIYVILVFSQVRADGQNGLQQQRSGLLCTCLTSLIFSGQILTIFSCYLLFVCRSSGSHIAPPLGATNHQVASWICIKSLNGSLANAFFSKVYPKFTWFTLRKQTGWVINLSHGIWW